MWKWRIASVLVWLGIAIAGPPALAQDLVVTSPAIDGGQVVLSLEDLDALPQESFATSTIWTDEVVTFSGVPLSVLIAETGAAGQSVSLIALNDYVATLPAGDIDDRFPIVATRMNGAEMSVRQKGPFWIVYPYDDDPAYRTETVYSRSVWQLREVEISD